MSSLELVSSVRSFNGYQNVYKHKSESLSCEMTFGAYIPDGAQDHKFPALFYLSGLTCTHANVMEKSGFQGLASKYGMVVVHPDTSPRGVDLPGDSDSWDFGKGAGFYVDATVEPWKQHYNMYTYVVRELTELVGKNLPVDMEKVGIFGHSMGGHGAITIALKNPTVFKSVSAFAPICNPVNCAWGKKAFSNYLGADVSTWEEYDASILAQKYSGPTRLILIDQGEADKFLSDGQLQPETIKETDSVKVSLHIRAHYDHSYYFISSFMESHFEHHKKELGL